VRSCRLCMSCELRPVSGLDSAGVHGLVSELTGWRWCRDGAYPSFALEPRSRLMGLW
jgi:hypothetical protein